MSGCLRKSRAWLSRAELLSVGPVLVLGLRLLLRVAVLHGDASGQDGGHVVARRLPLLGLLLLTLLLDLPQLDPCGTTTNSHSRSQSQPLA